MFTRHVPQHSSCYGEYIIYFYAGEDTGRVPNPYPHETSLGRGEARRKYGWVGTARRYSGRNGEKPRWGVFGELSIPDYQLPYETPPQQVEEDVITQLVMARMGV